MIFLFTAPKNSYFLFRERKIIQEKAKEARHFWASFDSENWPPQKELSSFLGSDGFFEEEKSLFFTNATTLLINQVEFLKELIKKRETAKNKKTNLYFFEEGPVKKAPFYVFLKRQAGVNFKEFKDLKGLDFENFLKEEAGRLGLTVEVSGLKKLGPQTKFDAWEARWILERAYLAKDNQRESITEKDLAEVTSASLEENVFLALEALVSGNKALALDLFFGAKANGAHPLYLFSMITYQTRTLAMVKSAQEEGLGLDDTSKKTGIHPYVLKKTSSLLNKVSMERIKKMYNKLAEIDFSVKTGKIDSFLALDLFVIFA